MLDRVAGALEAIGLEPQAMDVRIARDLRRARHREAWTEILAEELRGLAELTPQRPGRGALRDSVTGKIGPNPYKVRHADDPT